jgi:hypothetical protein
LMALRKINFLMKTGGLSGKTINFKTP